MPEDTISLPPPVPFTAEAALVGAIYAGVSLARGTKSGSALVVAGWLVGRVYGALAAVYTPGFGGPGNLVLAALSVKEIQGRPSRILVQD